VKEFDPNRTPGTVIGAVAAGTVVVPFLIVYAFLFIAHGVFVDVGEPDVTSSRAGEALAGVVALAFLILVVLGMGRLLNGRGRWLFALGQAIALAASIDFVLDPSRGDPQVPALVLLGSLIAIVLALVPPSWAWVQTRGGTREFRPAADSAAPAGRGGTAASADGTDSSAGFTT
jgi:hypothetical protein